VVAPGEITARVPAGATTGPIQVTTPGGILSSSVPFKIPLSNIARGVPFLPRSWREKWKCGCQRRFSEREVVQELVYNDELAATQWALNSAVECHPHTVEVVGSNPTAPTITYQRLGTDYAFVPLPTLAPAPDPKGCGAGELFQNGPLKFKFVCLEAAGSRRSPANRKRQLA
jgi:hypothetical protein